MRMYINENIRAFIIESLTGDRGGIGRRSHSFTWGIKLSCCSNTKASFLLLSQTVSLSSHPRPGPPVTPGAPAPADKEGKRETGRTPEGNRCQRYQGFTYREERGGGTGFREGKINISLEFIVLISEMITQFAICSTEWHDIIKSCGKHCIQRTFTVIQPMVYMSDITTVCRVGVGGSQDTETCGVFLSQKKEKDKLIWIFSLPSEKNVSSKHQENLCWAHSLYSTISLSSLETRYTHIHTYFYMYTYTYIEEWSW